jgi:hypothetical protein
MLEKLFFYILFWSIPFLFVVLLQKNAGNYSHLYDMDNLPEVNKNHKPLPNHRPSPSLNFP